MFKQIILSSIFFSCIFFSCESKKDEIITSTKNKDSLHTHQDSMNHSSKSSKTSIDWVGTYEGVLPCADCPGIKTTVTLNKDQTIKVVSEYLKKKTKLVDEGTFKWTADNNALYLDTKDKNRYFYKIEENKIVQLSQEGLPIEGNLADIYVLKKK